MSINLDAFAHDLDHHITHQQWDAARPIALALAEQMPTTPGVVERAILVLRQLNDWRSLSDFLLEMRNRYQLWPQGSDLLMGQAMVEQREWQRAIPYLEMALREDANAGWAQHFLGKALRHTGRLEDALGQQQQATDLLPQFAWAPFEAAELLIQLEREAEAILELQEARRRVSEPDAVIEATWERLQPVVLKQQAIQLMQAGSTAQAFAMARQASLLSPNDPAIKTLVAELLGEPTKNNEGLSSLEAELSQIEILLDYLESSAGGTSDLDGSDLSYL